MKRIFLIGNGPSLADTPLNMLIGEDTFAMNNIHRIYDKTDWRPKYYLRIDHNPRNPNWVEQTIPNLEVVEHAWLWEAMKDGLPKNHPSHADMPRGVGSWDNVTWIPRCEKHHYYASDNYQKRGESWHLPTICTAFSGMYPMLQIAALKGYDIIYLLGCDLKYQADKTLNHFVPDYIPFETGDISKERTRNNVWLHKVSRLSCPVPIVNLTPDSALDVYPHKTLEEALDYAFAL